jgi:hypothetical protein
MVESQAEVEPCVHGCENILHVSWAYLSLGTETISHSTPTSTNASFANKAYREIVIEKHSK